MGGSVGKDAGAPYLSNQALILVKPDANTQNVVDFVRESLSRNGTVVDEGTVSAEEIKEKELIEKHYSAIATYAKKTDPAELVVSEQQQQQFQTVFGSSWTNEIAAGRVLNFATASSKLALDEPAFAQAVREAEAQKLSLKLAPGCYVTKLKAHNLFVVNGFFATLHQKFVAPGASVHYFVFEFEPKNLSWQSFRSTVIGTTLPATALKGSLRSEIHSRWKELGLSAEPTLEMNAVQGSAGPLEALRERILWTGKPIDEDPFGKALLKAGIGRAMLDEWLENRVDTLHERTGPVFDLTENLNSGEVLAALKERDLFHFKRRAQYQYNEGQEAAPL